MVKQSNAEKQRKYRERLREKGQLQEHLKRRNKKRNEKRRNLTRDELRAIRINERNCKRKSRSEQDAAIQPDSERSPSGYSAQGLGKAMHRVKKSLPHSPRKRSKLIRQLVKSYDIVTDGNAGDNRGGHNQITEDTCKVVVEFYCRDDVSWQSPGRKDTIIEKDSNGQKVYTPKRFLVLTLKECHVLFCQEFPQHAVSLSKFCSLRPAYVFLSKDFPHNVCVCRHHENVRLLLECIQKHVTNKEIPIHFREFIGTSVCNQEIEECMTGKCAECSQKFDEEYNFPDQSDTSVEWYQWLSVEGRWLKLVQKGTFQAALLELKRQLPVFLVHTFIKRKQSAHFEPEKRNVDGKNIVIQVDFAENYSVIQQNEIQSGHWAHEQVTLFTVCANIDSERVKTYVIVSDDLEHGKYQVATFLNQIILDMKKECPDLGSIAFFSDGAASQFKQRFLFHNITYYEELYGIKVSWNFFATSHGKGAVDGIGGLVKRLVWNGSRTGAYVKDAQSFASEAVKRVDAIKILYVPQREVEDYKEALAARWEATIPLPNTHSTHTVVPIRKHVVRYAMYATSEDYRTHILEPNADLPGPDIVNSGQPSTSSSKEHLSVKVGDCVLLQYEGPKQTNFKYVAQITEIKDKEYFITHLHKSDSKGTVFVAKDVTDKYGVIEENQIVRMLPSPIMDNRERYHFTVPIPEAR